MAFDALHIIWTTSGCWLPQNDKGYWGHLLNLYVQITRDDGYYQAEHISLMSPEFSPEALSLTLAEQNILEKHLLALMSADGDRIAGNLPLECYVIKATTVHLLFVPALPVHNQIIGRLKSKTASQLLRGPREGQEHLWSKGYWFANINGARAIEKVKQFMWHEQHD